jgi:phosphate transport system protein
MTQVFVHEVDKLKRKIMSLSAQVEENVVLAVKALLERDEALAKQIILSDAQIDAEEVEVEEEALKILALYQPVAMDLRFLTSVLKINNDLERIGDLAANIARRARRLSKESAVSLPPELQLGAVKVRDMVRNSLTAFVNLDVALANQVREADDEVDDLCRQVTRFVEAAGKENPEDIRAYLTMMRAVQSLERIGDHATNIAEDVVYLIDGVIVRHKPVEDDED